MLPLHSNDEALCRHCGLVPQGALEADFLCSVCHHDPPAFDLARAAASFRGGVRELVHAFKYQRAIWLKRDLVDLLQGCLRSFYEVEALDLLMPIPLHPQKERQRGYNQAALLTAELARRQRLTVSLGNLYRARSTPSQTRLNASKRRINVHGAFSVSHPELVRGRSILLIDDVMTTGATLHEAAATLKRAGAWRVWAMAIARG